MVVQLSRTTKNMLEQPNSVQWLPLGQPMATRRWYDLALRNDATLNVMKLWTYWTFCIAAFFSSSNTVILWTKPFNHQTWLRPFRVSVKSVMPLLKSRSWNPTFRRCGATKIISIGQPKHDLWLFYGQLSVKVNFELCRAPSDITERRHGTHCH